MNVIHINQLSLSFGDNVLFDSFDLSVKPSEWVALLGRSGCGKTTLLKAIAGLSHGAQQTGTVRVNAKWRSPIACCCGSVSVTTCNWHNIYKAEKMPTAASWR